MYRYTEGEVLRKRQRETYLASRQYPHRRPNHPQQKRQRQQNPWLWSSPITFAIKEQPEEEISTDHDLRPPDFRNFHDLCGVRAELSIQLNAVNLIYNKTSK